MEIQNHIHGKCLSHHTQDMMIKQSPLTCFLQMDDEPFNPDYVEVDRVLDVSESTDENGEVLVSLSRV